MPKNTKINSTVSKASSFLRPFETKAFTIIGHLLNKEVENTSVPKHRSFRSFVFRFSKMFSGVLGFTIFISIILGAFIIPFFASDYKPFNLDQRNLKPFESGHILGTNYLGQDIWSMI